MSNNKLTVKDILDISPEKTLRLYKMLSEEEKKLNNNDKGYTFAFEGTPEHVPHAFYDLPVVKLDSGCEYEIDGHYIAIFFKEKDTP